MCWSDCHDEGQWRGGFDLSGVIGSDQQVHFVGVRHRVEKGGKVVKSKFPVAAAFLDLEPSLLEASPISLILMLCFPCDMPVILELN